MLHHDQKNIRAFTYFPGKVDDGGELTEKEIIRAERNSGVISNRVREIQVSSLANLAINSDLKLHARTFGNLHSLYKEEPFLYYNTNIVSATCLNLRCKTI